MSFLKVFTGSADDEATLKSGHQNVSFYPPGSKSTHMSFCANPSVDED